MYNQYIGIYPLSFVQTAWVRRMLLIVLYPFVVLGNAIWFFVPIARPLKNMIFRHGFWSAVISATKMTWNDSISPAAFFGGQVFHGQVFHDSMDDDEDDDIEEGDFDRH